MGTGRSCASSGPTTSRPHLTAGVVGLEHFARQRSGVNPHGACDAVSISRGVTRPLSAPKARGEANRDFCVYRCSSHRGLRAAADLGLRVPQDVAVVSFDGIIGSRFTVPSLTTVAQPIEGLACRSMELLIKLVRDPSAETTHQVLPVELIIRESCGCATGSVAGRSPALSAKGPGVTK